MLKLNYKNSYQHTKNKSSVKFPKINTTNTKTTDKQEIYRHPNNNFQIISIQVLAS